MSGNELEFIRPDWPSPGTVAAVSTTRAGGISVAPYASLNLGDHVGDDGHSVQSNRRALISALGLTDRPRWLNQVHGSTIVDAEAVYDPVEADASIASTPGVAAVIMTADCLPILICDRAGTCVAAVHGGWRSLATDLLHKTLAAFARRGVGAQDLMVWLGPAISAPHYEVGRDVREAFPPEMSGAFTANPAGRWQLDLYELARLQLMAAGVTGIYGGDCCTHEDSRLFSYRRDGLCGRQASLIWLKY